MGIVIIQTVYCTIPEKNRRALPYLAFGAERIGEINNVVVCEFNQFFYVNHINEFSITYIVYVTDSTDIGKANNRIRQ